MTLLFMVRNQTVTLIDTKVEPRIGSAKYLNLRFKFASKDWTALRRTVYLSAGEFAEPFILEGDILAVPTYYTQQSSFNVTLLGDSEGQLVPTNVVTVTLDESNSLWTATPPDPQSSAYVALLDSVGNVSELQTEDKSSVVAAVNELFQRPSGGASMDDQVQVGLLIDCDMLPAVYDSNGAILTDEKGSIILRF